MHEGDDVFAGAKIVDVSEVACLFSENSDVGESASTSEGDVDGGMTKSTSTRTTNTSLLCCSTTTFSI